MRLFFFSLLLTGLSSMLAQQNTVTLSGQLQQCEQDSLYLFVADGTMLRPIQKFPLQKNETHASFQLVINDIPETSFFYVGGGQRNNTRLMVLGPDPQVHLTGTCPTLGQGQLQHSSSTDRYEWAKRQNEAQQQAFSGQLNRYRRAGGNAEQKLAIQAEMEQLDQQKLAFLDSLKALDPFLGKLFALKTYLSFQNQGADFASEGHYFAERYFQFADLADPVYNRSPHLFEAFNAYAQTLPRVGLPLEAQFTYAETALSSLTVGQTAHRMALLGLAYGFKGGNGDAFVKYAEQYLQYYANHNAQATQQLRPLVEAEKKLLIGALAPEIHLPNPAGDSLRLSDLRGKIVMIDFWASWCGPCRRENPNVVRVYQQYQDKGFEILGVSLDRSKEPWLKAIEKDQLSWLHVSDLKYWSSVAAQTYGIHSVPATVLLDRKGHIIAKGLRGPALEAKLAELFDEEGQGR